MKFPPGFSAVTVTSPPPLIWRESLCSKISDSKRDASQVLPAWIKGFFQEKSRPVPVVFKNYYYSPDIVRTQIPASRLSEISREMDRLSRLPENWDDQGASPPNAQALENAKTALSKLDEICFLPIRVMPAAEGGISFYFTTDEFFAEIEFDNEGDITAGISDGTRVPITWQVDAGEDDLDASIERIREHFRR